MSSVFVISVEEYPVYSKTNDFGKYHVYGDQDDEIHRTDSLVAALNHLHKYLLKHAEGVEEDV